MYRSIILVLALDLPQPWVIQLVESMSQNIDVLPLQCLADYLLHSSIQRIQAADEKALNNGMTMETSFPLSSSGRTRQRSGSSTDTTFDHNADADKLGTEGIELLFLLAKELFVLNILYECHLFTIGLSASRRARLDNTGSSLYGAEKSSIGISGAGIELNRRRLYNRILERLRQRARSPSTDPATGAILGPSSGQLGSDTASQSQPIVDNIAEAVLQSFASRLRDPSSLIRRAARYVSSL